MTLDVLAIAARTALIVGASLLIIPRLLLVAGPHPLLTVLIAGIQDDGTQP